MNLEPTHYLAHCPDCHKERDVELLQSMVSAFPKVVSSTGRDALGMVCEPCIANGESKVKDANAARESGSRASVWEALCPFEFRTIEENGFTDSSLLSKVKLTTSTDGQSVRFDPARLYGWGRAASSKLPVTLLLGPPGTMKTRLAWRVARACFDSDVPRPRQFLFQSSWEFQARLQDEAGKFNAFRWVRSQIEVPLWILDDLCKTDWTDNTAAAFFEILDRRIAHRLPILMTGNHAGADLKAWFQASRSPLLRDSAEAILRRLREKGQVIVCR